MTILDSYYTAPFQVRLWLLVIVLSVIALCERLIRGREAHRWAEYGCLIVVASFTAVLGAAVSRLSVAVSPGYYLHLKDLPGSPALVRSATQLGSQAGFFGGLVIAGTLLVANSRRSIGVLPLRTLVPYLRWPCLLALISALSLGSSLFVYGFVRSESLSVASYYSVLGFHGGIYLGAALGLALSVQQVGRRELNSPPSRLSRCPRPNRLTAADPVSSGLRPPQSGPLSSGRSRGATLRSALARTACEL